VTSNKKVPAPQVVRRVVQPKPDGQRGYAPPPRQGQNQQPSTSKSQKPKIVTKKTRAKARRTDPHRPVGTRTVT